MAVVKHISIKGIDYVECAMQYIIMSSDTDTKAESVALVPELVDDITVGAEQQSEEADEKLIYPHIHDSARFLLRHAKDRILNLPEYQAAVKSGRSPHEHHWKFQHNGTTFKVTQYNHRLNSESFYIDAYPPGDPDPGVNSELQTNIDIHVGESPERIEQNTQNGRMSEVSWITFKDPTHFTIETLPDGTEIRQPIRDTSRTLHGIANFLASIK